MKASKTTFSWSNYTKPTPNNLLGLAAFLANVAHDVEEATAQFPSGDVVTVTKEVKEEDNLNKNI